MPLDLSLYLVTDRTLLTGKDFFWTVEQAILGGVTIVQLREKEATSREFYQLAKKLKQMLDKHNIPLIINDRLDIALAVDAAGVHLGQSDLPCDTARKLLSKRKIIGLSVESLQQAQATDKSLIDYIGYSPVFATNTKADTASPLNLAGVQAISSALPLPGVGIGGIDCHNAQSVIEAGATGVAVVSAIMSAKNPQKAAYELRKKINQVKLCN